MKYKIKGLFFRAAALGIALLTACGGGKREEALAEAVAEDGTATYYNILTGKAEEHKISRIPALIFGEEPFEIRDFVAVDTDGDGAREIFLNIYGEDGKAARLLLWNKSGKTGAYPFFPGETRNVKEDGSFYYTQLYGMCECVKRIDRLSEDGCEMYEETGAFGDGYTYTYFETGSRISDRESFEKAKADFEARPDAPAYEYTPRKIREVMGRQG